MHFRNLILAVVALLALAQLARPLGDCDPSREPAATSELGCSAIAFVQPEILRDVSKPSNTLADWGAAMRRFGDVTGILVPFSRAPGSTSLTRPRVLLTVAGPFSNNDPRDPYPSKRDLTTRLFLGLTTAPNHEQTLEFISWNQRTRRYDFGVIEHFDTPTKRNIVYTDAKRQECLACHRTGGPIFPVFPWTGMGIDPLFSVTMIEDAYRVDPKRNKVLNDALKDWKDRSEGSIGRLRLGITDPKYRDEPQAKLLRNATLFIDGRDTGVKFFERGESDRTAVFDGAVRDGNRNLSLPNELLNLLPAESRPLAARIVITRSLLDVYGEFPPDTLESFAAYLKEQQKALRTALKGKALPTGELQASRPSQIRDFDPVSGKPNHHPIATSDDNLSYVDTIRAYNAKREAGDLGVPEKFQPSGPPAFLVDNVPPTYTPAGAIRAEGAPGRIVLYRKDLDPLYDFLAKDKDKGVAGLKAILESAEIAEITRNGLPNRETLLSAIYAAATRQRPTMTKIEDRIPTLGGCDGPGLPPVAAAAIIAPKSACARCHIGADKVGRMRFDFDPEDRTAWKNAFTDPERRERARVFRDKVVRRLDGQSMPPDDSPEHDFRSAAELRALADYLRAL